MAEYRHLVKGDEEWEEIARTWPSDEDIVYNIHEMRATRLAALKLRPPGPDKGLQLRSERVPVEGGSIEVLVYIPDGEGDNPLLVWYHGGGFAMGTALQDDDWCRETCLKQRMSIVNCDYRLAPEFKFPTAVQDAYDTLKWAAEHAKELKADPAKGFMVGGISAGGNLSAVMALLNRDDPFFKVKLTGQLLISPQVCDTRVLPPECLSYNELHYAPLLSRKIMEFFKDAYIGGVECDPKAVERSPYYAESHKDLPAAAIFIAGADPLRDEAFAYGKKLRENGVNVTEYVYPAASHNLHRVGPNTKATKKYYADIQEAIENLMHRNI